MTAKRALTLIELLIVLAVVLVMLALSTAGLAVTREKSKKQRCADNLRLLGQACYLYADPLDPGYFPMIGSVRKQNDGAMVLFDKKNRTSQPGTEALPSPTVDMWALVRDKNATTRHFICPATSDKRDPAQDVMAYYDFTSAENLSYAYQYQYDPDRKALGWFSEPTFPVMADGNPYIKGKKGKKNILKDRNSKYRGNSRNHGKKRPGQNVLFQDGHVAWEKSPSLGLPGHISRGLVDSRGRDNIYTTHEVGPGACVDPGAAKPTKKRCNLGGRSDACLVP